MLPVNSTGGIPGAEGHKGTGMSDLPANAAADSKLPLLTLAMQCKQAGSNSLNIPQEIQPASEWYAAVCIIMHISMAELKPPAAARHHHATSCQPATLSPLSCPLPTALQQQELHRAAQSFTNRIYDKD